jgi:hypothetical protein
VFCVLSLQHLHLFWYDLVPSDIKHMFLSVMADNSKGFLCTVNQHLSESFCCLLKCDRNSGLLFSLFCAGYILGTYMYILTVRSL